MGLPTKSTSTGVTLPLNSQKLRQKPVESGLEFGNFFLDVAVLSGAANALG